MNNDFQNQNNEFNPNMGMANPQPMNSPMPDMGMGNSMADVAPKSGNNKPLIIGGIIGIVVVVGIVLAAVFLSGGKRMVCTLSRSQGGNELKMKTTLVQKKDYIEALTNLDVVKNGGFTDDEIKQLKESLETSYDDEDNFKITTSKNKITVSFRQKEYDSSLDDAKKSFEDMGCTCK